MSKDNLYDFFHSTGFRFSAEVLTRYYLAMKTKPFVLLTGISGTGKTKIAQLFARYICQHESQEELARRIAFVAVRPDWLDNKGLLGFYNILDEKYHSTKVLDLLLTAADNPNKPYFVILDEMNLAKVEHYFSDFLSIMESRTSDNPSGEMIQLHSRQSATTATGTEIPGEIHIPRNVFFTGTVNIDESTYMFSPKVLDRANVIEFNDVNLADYGTGAAMADDGFHLGSANVLDSFYATANPACCATDDYLAFASSHPHGAEYLRKLSAILQQYNLHFGYRVVNEVCRFINLAAAETDDFTIDAAFDIQFVQKILTKLHGTRAKLEQPLNDLLSFCYAAAPINGEDLLVRARNYDRAARFPRAAKKIAQMRHQLEVQGYACFIE